MVAVKDGNVIVTGTGDDAQYYYASQDDVDDFIARDLTFGEILADNLMQLENINRILYDDQEPVTEDKRVDVATIARNSEIFIYVEPQFVPAEIPPVEKVVYSAVRGNDMYLATYQGKAIRYPRTSGFYVAGKSRSEVEALIAQGTTFGPPSDGNRPGNFYTYIDGAALTVDNTLTVDDVASNAPIDISLEPSYIDVS